MDGISRIFLQMLKRLLIVIRLRVKLLRTIMKLRLQRNVMLIRLSSVQMFSRSIRSSKAI